LCGEIEFGEMMDKIEIQESIGVFSVAPAFCPSMADHPAKNGP
jgi:hypothetical protein